MKKIGGSLQYNVYNLENGRVLKQPTTFEEKIKTLYRWYHKYPWQKPFSREDAVKLANETLEDMKKAFNGIKSRIIHAPFLAGNPKFLDNYCYEQDLVKPLGTYFSQHSLEENKRAVDKYIICTQQLWTIGIGERVFKFCEDTGINEMGDVVLMDIGTIAFSTERLAKNIAGQVWLQQHAFKIIKSKELRQYCAQVMQKHVTVESLNAFWESKLPEYPSLSTKWL